MCYSGLVTKGNVAVSIKTELSAQRSPNVFFICIDYKYFAKKPKL